MITIESVLKIDKLEHCLDGKNLQNLTFPAVSIDSRTIGNGELFVAIEGEKFDGHDFIQEAFKKGAGASIVNKHKYDKIENFNENFILFKVEDTLKALQELSRIHRNKMDCRVIGITGTNGKTTTKEMLFSILSKTHKVLKSFGNYNNQYGVPLTLLQLTDEYDFAIIEMGASKEGDIRELCEIALPNIGILTCAGKGHLEYFKTIEKVAKTKAELLEFLNGFGIAVVNGEDDYLRPYYSRMKDIIQFGFFDEADIRGFIISENENFGTLLKINDEIEIYLRVPGRKNMTNALAAASTARILDISFSVIKEGLESYKPFTGRLQVKRTGDFNIIDDTYNSNPESLSEAISILGSQKISGKKFAILGDMLELGDYSETEHKNMGKLLVENKIDYVLTFGNLAKCISDECNRMNHKNSRHFENKSKITEFLKNMIKKNDLVLVKGSRGMKMEEIVKDLEDIYGREE